MNSSHPESLSLATVLARVQENELLRENRKASGRSTWPDDESTRERKERAKRFRGQINREGAVHPTGRRTRRAISTTSINNQCARISIAQCFNLFLRRIAWPINHREPREARREPVINRRPISGRIPRNCQSRGTITRTGSPRSWTPSSRTNCTRILVRAGRMIRGPVVTKNIWIVGQ